MVKNQQKRCYVLSAILRLFHTIKICALMPSRHIVSKQLIKRNEYTASIIDGTEIEPFDLVNTETKYQNEVSSLITKKSIKYNGAVNSEIKYYTKEQSIQ